MKKTLKFLAQFILIWVAIAAVTYITYTGIAKPIVFSYEKYGWEGVWVAIAALTVVYTVFAFIVYGFGKLIDYATE